MLLNKFKTTPLIIPCLGLIWGISIAQLELISATSCIYATALILSFLLIYQKELILKKPLFYQLQLLYIFTSLGVICLSSNQEVYKKTRGELFKDNQPFLANVESIVSTPENKFKHKIILSVQGRTGCLEPNSVCLFLRKNFLQIGDLIFVKKYKVSELSFFDVKSRCLGSIFYQPMQTKIWKITSVNPSFLQKINIFTQELHKKIMSKMKETTSSFYGLIFLGLKQKEVCFSFKELFQSLGISHYLARSGLHLSIFSYLSIFCCSLLPISVFWRFLISLFLSLIYSLFTFASISFVRSETMFLLSMLAGMLRMPSNSLHFLMISCLIILAFNPWQLFAIDFQLSFILVFSLLVAVSSVQKD